MRTDSHYKRLHEWLNREFREIAALLGEDE